MKNINFLFITAPSTGLLILDIPKVLFFEAKGLY